MNVIPISERSLLSVEFIIPHDRGDEVDNDTITVSCNGVNYSAVRIKSISSAMFSFDLESTFTITNLNKEVNMDVIQYGDVFVSNAVDNYTAKVVNVDSTYLQGTLTITLIDCDGCKFVTDVDSLYKDWSNI